MVEARQIELERETFPDRCTTDVKRLHAFHIASCLMTPFGRIVHREGRLGEHLFHVRNATPLFCSSLFKRVTDCFLHGSRRARRTVIEKPAPTRT